VGRNEELIGRAMLGRRDQIIVATEFGNVRGPDGAFLAINGRPEYVRQACRQTLASQLAEVGVTPEEIAHIAFSHAHFDHVGNSRLFSQARRGQRRRQGGEAAFPGAPRRIAPVLRQQGVHLLHRRFLQHRQQRPHGGQMAHTPLPC
jgi:glyoxylase-like metal-dependent hydrolase (beta-lactamase superfamily II)